MAELLLVEEWAEAGSLALYLREALPDGYIIVSEPVVHGQPLDAVVVGPQGFVVLYPQDWGGLVVPSRRGPWRERLASGEEVRHPNPAAETNQATKALQVFLQDEFPGMQPGIRHLLVLTNPEAKVMEADSAEPYIVGQDRVAETITSMEPPPGDELVDEEIRRALALALRDRQLTASQRASEPFVFRGGGLFGSGKKVWTVEGAIRHMDRYPEDGIFHLHNRTLAHWFAEQGADHLAELALAVTRQPERDPRIPLETFLIATGLVDRPRLVVQPRRVNLGYVLSGETGASRFQIRKGQGRGYLFGNLHTSDPWLRVDPMSFRGGLDGMVTANTETLPIGRRPWEAEILVESSASEEAVGVPVRVRVMGMPSSLNRRVLRPLAGAVSSGLVGAVLGWALGRWGLGAPGWFVDLGLAGISWELACALLTGLFWAILGVIRGLRQPLAWPVTYATAHWLWRTLLWGIALSLLAVVSHWAWRLFGPDPAAGEPGTTTLSAVLLALALSIVPSTLGEIRSARVAVETRVQPARRPVLRTLLLGAAGLGLALAVVAGVILLLTAWQQLDMDSRMPLVQEWAGEQWTQFEADADGFFDEMTLRYYQRRAAPTATPAPTRWPTPAP